MIVELKKVKITKSIFNQLVSPALSLQGLNSVQVLGWVFDKNRFILLYNPETNALSRLSTISNMKIDYIKPNIVNFSVRGMTSNVQLAGMSDAHSWIARINEINSLARIDGQLFI